MDLKAWGREKETAAASRSFHGGYTHSERVGRTGGHAFLLQKDFPGQVVTNLHVPPGDGGRKKNAPNFGPRRGCLGKQGISEGGGGKK